MGYAIAMGTCFGCNQPFSFNPLSVPSIKVNGTKEPICLMCVERVNPMRKANGLPEIVPLPDAYAPIEENMV